MSAPPPRRLLLPVLITLAGLAVLIALGTWQLERKAWKQNLIAMLTERLAAAPAELPREWSALTQANSEFRRVRLHASFGGGDALVYTSGSALRDDVKAPGYFVFAPATLADGRRVVVNRGYTPARDYPAVTGESEIVGALRWPDASSWFVADHGESGRIWHVRDPRKMAQALGWGEVAPFYVEQEAPVPAAGVPHPAPLTVKLPDNHLQYALTWYGLALALLAVFFVWLRRRVRSEGP